MELILYVFLIVRKGKISNLYSRVLSSLNQLIRPIPTTQTPKSHDSDSSVTSLQYHDFSFTTYTKDFITIGGLLIFSGALIAVVIYLIIVLVKKQRHYQITKISLELPFPKMEIQPEKDANLLHLLNENLRLKQELELLNRKHQKATLVIVGVLFVAAMAANFYAWLYRWRNSKVPLE